jgi:hypothetical protein
MGIADEEIVHYQGESGGVGGCGGGRAWGWWFPRNHICWVRRVGTRDQIGGGQGQSSGHHKKEKVCRGSDGGKEGDQVL